MSSFLTPRWRQSSPQVKDLGSPQPSWVKDVLPKIIPDTWGAATRPRALWGGGGRVCWRKGRTRVSRGPPPGPSWPSASSPASPLPTHPGSPTTSGPHHRDRPKVTRLPWPHRLQRPGCHVTAWGRLALLGVGLGQPPPPRPRLRALPRHRQGQLSCLSAETPCAGELGPFDHPVAGGGGGV